MANLFTSGFETGAITTEPDYSSTTGTVSLETSVVNSGTSAISVVGSAGNQFVTFRYSASALPLTTIIYARCYIRLTALPSAIFTAAVLVDSGFAGGGSLKISTTGTVQLFDNVGIIGSQSSVLSLNTWYMIEVASQINGTTTGYLEARLNGVSFATTNAGHNNGVGLRDFRVGVASGTAPTATIYVDDLSVNDNSGATNNSWPGILPSAPTNSVAPTISGMATKGQMLTSSTGTWSNSPTAYTYQWKRSTDGGSTYTTIDGMTSAGYFLVSADIGNKLRCDVTAANSGGSNTASTTGSASIASATITVPTLGINDYKGLNYYPAANAWQYMWYRWDAAQINADMATMASLNANLIRCIIPADATYFGYPTPFTGMTNRIEQFVSMAAAHGLLTFFTLFDKFSTYTDISGSETWASAVLANYSGDNRIAFIELQNEIDGTNSSIITWAQALLPYIRGLMPGTKTTVSTSDPTGNFAFWSSIVTNLDAYMDFYNLHLYNKLARAYGTMKACKAAIGGKQLWIGETGFTTNTGNTGQMSNLPVGAKSYEYIQEFWFRVFAANAEALGMPKITPWIVFDLTAGAQPGGVDSNGQNFGLIRLDGSEKPAVNMFRKYFGTGQYSKELNNGFETATENTLPSVWQLNQSTLATFTRDTANPHSGMASGSISASAGSSSLRPSFYTNPAVATLPGKRYQLTFWAKGSSLTGVNRGYIAWFDSTDTFLSNSNFATIPLGTSAWTQYFMDSVCPATAVYCQIVLESYTNTGQVWFDDVTFEEVKQTTTFINIGNNQMAYDQRLRWRPPDQVTPTVVTIGTGFYGNTFGATEDVIIIHPSSTRFSSINVTGGRHIRVIGGDNVRSSTGTSFFFQGVSGSVFLEGQNLDTSALSADAVNIFGQTTTPFSYYPDIYIQNCRLMNINGSNAGLHADIFQAVGSMGNLYIDKLTASSNYQGISLFQKQFPISGNVYISRTNLSYSSGGDPTTYLTWFIDSLTGFTPYVPIYLDQVYVHPRTSQDLSQAVAPFPGQLDINSAAIGALTSDSYASVYFPNATNIHGVIYSGDPPTGDFCPSGTPGLNYTSPGYK